ncbi:MAG: GNAT family N-acetyltransferase [Oscillospiraceae bacterium]|nr:GNAT family N-acetyltransferase [Oscillospiraceae bacterium]
MEYSGTVILKDGRECIIRNGTADDGKAALENYILTHEQTDNLLAYADECDMTPETESIRLELMRNSPKDAELLAIVDGKVAGMAGLDHIGKRFKVQHRASVGISVDREYWSLGIGRALMEACVECGRRAGYDQLELDVVSTNDRAIALYESLGFREFGRNPKAFRTREGAYQELIDMRLEL